MRLHLVDVQAPLVAAWRHAFSEFPEVETRHGDILEIARGALVSPANSHGFMDGGIDKQYSEFFDPIVQRRVLDVCRARPEGHLPVGASAVVATDHKQIPWLIVAPTMFTPSPVPASHAYRALRAVLRLHGTHEALDGDVFSPGLATFIGRVEPEEAASEMAAAYRDWKATLDS